MHKRKTPEGVKGVFVMDIQLISLELLRNLAPAIASVITILFTFKKERKQTANIILSDRLNHLYVPLYLFYIKHRLYEVPLSDWKADGVLELLSLLNDNVHYASAESQKLFIEFKQENIRFIQYKLSGKNNVDAKSLDNAAKLVIGQLLSEYKDICRKLNLPKPIDLFE